MHCLKICTNCSIFFPQRSRITASDQVKRGAETVSHCGFKQGTHMFDSHVSDKCERCIAST